MLLSGFAAETVKDKSNVLDLCTGTGIIPILLSAKTDATDFVGIEIQKDSADMAERSVKLNNLQDKISIVCGDIKEVGRCFKPASFKNVTCNPPYMPAGKGLKNPDGPMAIARHEILCSLEDVIAAASSCLEEKGHFYLVHRPNRLADIFRIMNKYRLEPKRLKMVHPFVDKAPNMILVEATKGGNPFLKVEKPIIVYQSQGQYTPEIYDIYGY